MSLDTDIMVRRDSVDVASEIWDLALHYRREETCLGSLYNRISILMGGYEIRSETK